MIQCEKCGKSIRYTSKNLIAMPDMDSGNRYYHSKCYNKVFKKSLK